MHGLSNTVRFGNLTRPNGISNGLTSTAPVTAYPTGNNGAVVGANNLARTQTTNSDGTSTNNVDWGSAADKIISTGMQIADAVSSTSKNGKSSGIKAINSMKKAKNVQSLKNAIGNAKDTLKKLQQSEKTYSSRDFSGEISKAESNISSTESKIGQAQQNVEKYRGDLSSKNGEISSKRSEIFSYSTQIASLQLAKAAAAAAGEDTSEIEKQIEEARQNKEKAQGELDELKKQRDNIKEQLKDAKETLRTEKRNLRKYKKELKDLKKEQAEYEQIKDDISKLKTEIPQQEKRLEQMKKGQETKKAGTPNEPTEAQAGSAGADGTSKTQNGGTSAGEILGYVEQGYNFVKEIIGMFK